jgi:hypothetical protein
MKKRLSLTALAAKASQEPEVTEPEETVPDTTTEGDFDAGTPGIGGTVEGEGEG